MPSKFLHTKELLLISLISCCVFANTLFNGFVGDDNVFIVDNTFYTSLSHLPSLFTSDYFPGGEKDLASPGHYYSGSVAYRPVLSLSYFIDYFLWQLNPAGYHLTNVLIHLVNGLFAYILFFMLLKEKGTALLIALLFSVHPIQTEAVANIGYRADLLGFCFVLAALISLVKSDVKSYGNRTYYALSQMFYFLALFTKESSIVFLPLVMGYDLFFRQSRIKTVLGHFTSRYAGYVISTVFYLYIYFFVFPNRTLGQVAPIGDNIGTHIIASLWIFVLHVKHLALPFLTHMIPPLYTPHVSSYTAFRVISALLLLAGFLSIFVSRTNRDKGVMFGVYWFLIALIPVSNLILNVNPIAHRYMYLPSLGFIAFIVLMVRELAALSSASVNKKRKVTVIAGIIIIWCAVMTFTSNYYWRSNHSVAQELIKRYPNHFKGYSILGFALRNAGRTEEARIAFQKSYELGSRDPKVIMILRNEEEENKH